MPRPSKMNKKVRKMVKNNPKLAERNPYQQRLYDEQRELDEAVIKRDEFQMPYKKQWIDGEIIN